MLDTEVPAFAVGQRVTWTSQSHGVTKTKSGEIAAVIHPGYQPDRDQYPSLYGSDGQIGKPRNNFSYVVKGDSPVGKVRKNPKRPTFYWPVVSQLKLEGSDESFSEIPEVNPIAENINDFVDKGGVDVEVDEYFGPGVILEVPDLHKDSDAVLEETAKDLGDIIAREFKNALSKVLGAPMLPPAVMTSDYDHAGELEQVRGLLRVTLAERDELRSQFNELFAQKEHFQAETVRLTKVINDAREFEGRDDTELHQLKLQLEEVENRAKYFEQLSKAEKPDVKVSKRKESESTYKSAIRHSMNAIYSAMNGSPHSVTEGQVNTMYNQWMEGK